MNLSLAAYEALELPPALNRQTSEVTSNPAVAFLTSAVLLMSGVMTIDGVQNAQELAHLQVFTNAFIQPNPFIRFPVEQLLAELEREPCLDPRPLLTLTRPFELSKRLLLVGLGYGMAMADGEANFPELAYLRAIAQRLKIPPRYSAILEAGFADQQPDDFDALLEVASMIDPTLFYADDPLFLDIANHVYAALNPQDSDVVLFPEAERWID